MRRLLNRWWFKALGSLLLVGVLLSWIRPGQVWAAFRRGDLRLLVLSLLLTPAVIAVKASRWLILARTGGRLSFRQALQSYLAGITLATITPMAVGEIGRGLFIIETENRTGLTGMAVLDKVIDFTTVSLFAGTGLVLTGVRAAQGIGTLVLIGTLAFDAALLFFLPRLPGLRGLSRVPGTTRLRISEMMAGAARASRWLVTLNMGLSLVGFGLLYGQAYLVLVAFWSQASWVVMPYLPIITVSHILPVTIGGVGMREWTAVLLFRQFGISEAVAVNATFVHFLMVKFVPAIAGGVVIGLSRRTRALLTGLRRF